MERTHRQPMFLEGTMDFIIIIIIIIIISYLNVFKYQKNLCLENQTRAFVLFRKFESWVGITSRALILPLNQPAFLLPDVDNRPCDGGMFPSILAKVYNLTPRNIFPS
jgi:hypothetical protein